MTVTHTRHDTKSVAQEHHQMVLDGTKLAWHMDRVRAWERGERFAPITIDMALTRACQASCVFCYALMQENERKPITIPVMERFLTDCAHLGVRAVSLVSDGESTMSPAFEYTVRRGHELGISMASGTNGYLVDPSLAGRILPALDYIRINYDAADEEDYCRIMGVKPEFFRRVTENVKAMVEIKRQNNLNVTIGLQQVLMPQYGDTILPLATRAIELGVDYLVIKHCSDDEFGSLGVNYGDYGRWYATLKQAEALGTERTKIIVKWNKITVGDMRSYSRCYGAPFILQISGSGLVAPCGMLFGERYAKFHIGNIVEESFKDIVMGDRYWQVMNYLASDRFDARRMCGALCLQDLTNRALDAHKKGSMRLEEATGDKPLHVNFI